MKTEYKYIHFVKAPDGKDWLIYSNRGKDMLGVVYYYSGWKCHVANMVDVAVFSAGCLRDIADFIDQLDGKTK